jgi:phosphatidylserine decarboxylase
MGLLDFIHRSLDSGLAQVKLVQNREVGWMCVNRKTGKYQREQQPILKKLKLLILFSKVVEWIDFTKLFRLWLHERTIKESEACSLLNRRTRILTIASRTK